VWLNKNIYFFCVFRYMCCKFSQLAISFFTLLHCSHTHSYPYLKSSFAPWHTPTHKCTTTAIINIAATTTVISSTTTNHHHYHHYESPPPRHAGTNTRTPTLDALARNGTLFTDFHVAQAFCAPRCAAKTTHSQ
jgi:hypothetical protein